ncbi:hypothetical protein CRG98_006840 [Punica granatum]|nr:hypothetical protein CRG98_006840 [Punica granatum]
MSHLRPRLLNYEGKLGLLLLGDDGCMELSVMEDLRDPILWKERNDVCLEGVGCPQELYRVNVPWFYVRKVENMGPEEGAFRFKVGGKKFEQKYVVVGEVFPFYSDYEPSNLRAPRPAKRFSRWIPFCPFMGL